MEPVEPVQMNIHQSNTYRKDLRLHFDDEPRVQEKQQEKDQQSCTSVFCSLWTQSLHKMLTFTGTLNLSRFRKNWDVMVTNEILRV